MSTYDLRHPVKGDRVIIVGEAYNGLQGKPAVVTYDLPSGFRVDVGGFEVVIKNPAQDLDVQGMKVDQVLSVVDTLRELLPADAQFEVKSSGTAVFRIQERDFRRAFDDFEYSLSRYGDAAYQVSILLTKTIGQVEFWSIASRDCLAEAEAWIAARNAAEESEAQQTA